VALIWAGWAWDKRKPYLKAMLKRTFWWNRSTQQDYLLVFLNPAIFLLLGIPWIILTIDIMLSTIEFWDLFGDVQDPKISGPWVISIYTLVLFLLDDASRYALHRVLHKFDFLWRIHQLHHSASTLTPLTTLRLHPLESLLYQIRSSLVHGICAGSSFFFFGFQADSWQIWGATLWVIGFNILGANLRHSPIPFSYGKLEKLLISPAQHQAHHGVRTMTKNYGSILSIWDRLGGSWRSGDKEYHLPKQARSLTKQLLLQHIRWK
jgi:sterol desaturase/sphingolipid hydroxylase (fatty acid hydroxylase superfamily)